MSCDAELHIADNYGDNHATCRCQLEEGHELPHRHVFKRDDLDGNRTDVVVTFYCDERERCDVCRSLDDGDDEGFMSCAREHPRITEAIERATTSYEERPDARPWERWSCTVTHRDVSAKGDGATQEDAMRSAYLSLRIDLEMELGVPCGRRLCKKCYDGHRCEDEPGVPP